MAKTAPTDERFDNIDKQLDTIVTAVVSGYDRVNKALESKVNVSDLQRIYDLLRLI